MQTTPERRAASWLPGAILIAIGAAIAAVSWFQAGGEIVVLALGAVFLVAYAATRSYGLLVPGGILTGLGLGIAGQSLVSQAAQGAPVVLGLGLGFLAIWAIDELVTRSRARWWPLIPGLILVVIGSLVGAGAYGALDVVATYALPVLLIVVGIWLLVRPRAHVR